MKVIRITPLAAAVDYDAAKKQLNLDPDDNSQQDFVGDLLLAATQEVENFTSLTLTPTDYNVKITHFASRVVLPLFPVGAVTGVTYVDDAGAMQTLATDHYDVDNYGGECIVRFNGDKPALDLGIPFPVSIAVSAGYAADALPPQARRSILMKITSWFEKREDHYSPGQMKSSDLLLVPISRNFP